MTTQTEAIPPGAVRRSLAWVTVATVVARTSQFVIGIVVARILSPNDFGVFAVALVVFTIVINISELGVGTAIVREHEQLENIAPTAVTLSIASSAGLAGLMYVVAPGLAETLGSTEAALPISVLALVVLLGGPGAVPAAILTRDFMQGRRFVADMANFAVSNAVLIGLAAFGWGVMAFVWSRVAGQLISVIMLIILCPRKIRPGFNAHRARELLVFGLPVIGSSLVGYTISSVSVIAIGRSLGTVPLGVYTLASNVTNWPLSLFSGVIDSIGLPVLSRVQSDLSALRLYVQNAMGVLTGSFFYVTAMCIALAQPLIEAVYGQKWAGAGPVLACFAAYGSFRVLIALLSVILIARNAPKRLFWIQVVWLTGLVPSVIAGILLIGVVGAAMANVVVCGVIVLPLALWHVHRASGLTAATLLAPVTRPLAAAVGSGFLAFAASSASPDPWLALVIGGVSGTTLYVAVLATWGKRVLAESRRLFFSKSGRDHKQHKESSHGAPYSTG
ncbi:lipopolysaccharide biosynthesis protein [Pseudarthrobacter phenanthrenivorans]|uniref:lipopolysaccharide biosynthesis protein n=1 Tax=Pseudarthrobacter phenanthrenivorans TaxID=361575 RepID=UPI0015E85E65|nr:lipopolysaccharide biosynthesis protein [Pseudarthrobacter phenanthrenivorans]